jgi:hypothetical protein
MESPFSWHKYWQQEIVIPCYAKFFLRSILAIGSNNTRNTRRH